MVEKCIKFILNNKLDIKIIKTGPNAIQGPTSVVEKCILNNKLDVKIIKTGQNAVQGPTSVVEKCILNSKLDVNQFMCFLRGLYLQIHPDPMHVV